MTPNLSVIVATTLPWDEIQSCLAALCPQLHPANAEVIVADAHDEPVPAGIANAFPEVRWLRHPGESVFRLRNRGILAARAPIVAITEDHCRPAPDWCQRILAAHKSNPEAAAIGGSVHNGPTQSVADWANFLLVFAPFIHPIPTGPAQSICSQANVSYKREILPSTLSASGFMEMLFNRDLLAAGRHLYADNAIQVHHIQSHGRSGTFAAHFHNGRCIATVRRATLSPAGRALRIASCSILPTFLLAYVTRHVAPKPRYWWPFLSSLPYLIGISFAHSAGELLGYTIGPGHCFERIR